MLGTTFFQLLSLLVCLFMSFVSKCASLCPLSLGLHCFSPLCTFVFFGLFLTTMHLWVVLTTMHLCVLWFFPHHYAPLCPLGSTMHLCVFFLTTMHLCVFFLTTMHLCVFFLTTMHLLSPLCTFVFFFVTFSVLFVMYVCCVCVCFVFVSSNSSHSTLVMLTCQLVFDS